MLRITAKPPILDQHRHDGRSEHEQGCNEVAESKRIRHKREVALVNTPSVATARPGRSGRAGPSGESRLCSVQAATRSRQRIEKVEAGGLN